MADQESLHAELKKLIVETLALEDTAPDEIENDAPLFGEGLGLDSIDALEIAMVLEERYGVTLDDDPEANQRVFESVRSLAAFVAESRVR
ncbi:MAG: acyl carrier protein [Deltaproteobacteria bacterium]|nr:acyl carrier protein [Deltaproteobacteria bacterium]MBW2577634.1 acyl carrier protein [Deltaproteobacteria bacterium]MBW2694306.1 acyl carrier protein [Deltaproteobacteria bacterium]